MYKNGCAMSNDQQIKTMRPYTIINYTLTIITAQP